MQFEGVHEQSERFAAMSAKQKDADLEGGDVEISASHCRSATVGPKRPKEEKLGRLRRLFAQLEESEEGVPSETSGRSKDEETEEMEETEEEYERETAAELLIKGGTERFRSLSRRAEKEVRQALCCMFYLKVELTLRRTSEFLIFLLGEARFRIEEDLEEGQRLTRMHGEIQQTAIVLVEKLRVYDQEVLWRTKAGCMILMQFQLGDAKHFFARPSLQQIMLDVWQGVRPDYFQRSLCRLLRVWMRLLLFGLANLVVVFLFAVAPGFEQYMCAQTISRMDTARQKEENHWKGILNELNSNNRWPYKFEKTRKVCWDTEDFEKAVREECQMRAYLVQSQMPLLIPRYKKALAILTNMAFAAYLIEEGAEDNLGTVRTVLVLILSAGAWLGEVAQCMTFASSPFAAQYSFHFWFMDRVNLMEFIAFACITWTALLVLIDPKLLDFAQQFKALGVLFLGISQFMAILRMSSVFGPLVSMTMSMIVDMIQWVVLLFPIIACVVAALVVLFKTKVKSCMPFEFDYLKGVVNFFEAQMGGELMQNSLECLRGEDESGIESPARFTGPLILMVGMWMIMILMLNMLIAMMAKTFDRIYESAMVDFQYHFIGNLLQMIEEPAVPPILRSFGVPWNICSTCWQWKCSSGSAEKITATQKHKHHVLLRQSCFRDMKKELQEREVAAVAMKEGNEVKIKMDAQLSDDECINLLSTFVTEFISEHASDTQVQDDLWKKQMAQKLFSMDMKVDALTTKFDRLLQQMNT